MDWSTDGQLLAVTSAQGSITVFVTQLHSLFAVSPPRLALLSSLAEVSLYFNTQDRVCFSFNFQQYSLTNVQQFSDKICCTKSAT